MSPKMDNSYAEHTAAATVKVPATETESPERAVSFSPMTPPPEDRATTAGESGRPSLPRMRRRSALKITSTPPPPPLPSPPSVANKRRTPSSVSVNARSSSVVASKGMLFSRSELRPPPLSASRKYDGNVGFGFRSMATAAAAASSMRGHRRGVRGDESSSLSWSDPISTGGPVGGGREAGGGSPPIADTGAVRPSESFATLRIIEARRRAAWSFSESSPSLSSPPPSLAALGSATSATTTNTSAASASKKASVPPLPKISSISIPTTVACPLRQPGESSSNQDNLHAAAAAAAATPTGCFNTNPTPVLSPAAKTSTVEAPLSEPRGADKAYKRESLERQWAAWQENEGPAPLLGKPAPAPVAIAAGRNDDSGDPGMFGRSSNEGGESRKWSGVGDFHEKVAFLGDYVASVFGRNKRVSVPQQRRCDDGVYEVECGVE